jgi:hypothetical protein
MGRLQMKTISLSKSQESQIDIQTKTFPWSDQFALTHVKTDTNYEGKSCTTFAKEY